MSCSANGFRSAETSQAREIRALVPKKPKMEDSKMMLRPEIGALEGPSRWNNLEDGGYYFGKVPRQNNNK